MELDKNWQWEKRKLACRIRPESCNPAADDLRERFAELAGVDLKEILSEMKTTRKKKEQTDKVSFDYEGDKKFKEVLNRAHILGASQQALQKMQDKDNEKAASLTQKNVKKVFGVLPTSPPKRVLLEIQRLRAKPLPDQDENKVATAKLERKLAKQRAARMKAIAKSNKEEEALRASSANPDATLGRNLSSSVFPPYDGDLFSTGGNYLNGMLYLSRMLDSQSKSQRNKQQEGLISSAADSKGGGTEDSSGSKKNESGNRNNADDDFKHRASNDDLDRQLGFSESSVGSDSGGSKLYCATALCNWSRNAANAQRLASEGAVRAIIQLFLEPSSRILRFCAGAFRFMSEHTVLAISMIDDGAISTMSDVINSTSDEFVLGNIAIALLNLTRLVGKEEKIVEAGAVLSLMNLIVVFPDMSGVCARGLYNLTCVDNSYALVERVIRALVSLSATGTSSVKHVCAAALCNLSDLKLVRTRLVEEGAINVLGTLSRGSETRTRRVCAVILQNLSATKSCRVEMCSRNCVGVAYGLSSDQDPIILRCIGLTLSRLALEPANCSRIVSESGITALCNIAVKYPTIPGISQPVAVAFQLLSSRPNIRVTVVQEGTVTAIASLLRLSLDLYTLQRSLLALCNLLTEHENHLPIVQQGLIVTMITLCNQDSDAIKDLCALAFLNLSKADESRKHIVNAGAVAAIIALSTHRSKTTQVRCAATLCYVASYETGMARMIADGIIPSLVGLVLAQDIETVRYSCAALCRLCTTVESGQLILCSGAVPHLVKRAIESDIVTKQFCGAVLSSLTIFESCRQKLSEMNITSAMTSLADLNDDVTKQRCLVAFANLSCEVSVHLEMVKKGVVGIIANLANSYQEVNYVCSAKALCNLACSEESRLQIATQGGVHTLMMISLVQSVDMETKLLCVIALNNLLDDATVSYMLDEGIVESVANLSKLPNARISHLCAKLFNRLSAYLEARIKMAEKTVALHALFAMCDSKGDDTVTLCVRTTSNLVLCEKVRSRTIDCGGLRVLEKGVALANQDAASLQCIQAIFSACSEKAFLVLMAGLTLPSTLLRVATACDENEEVKYTYALKALSLIAWYPQSRALMQSCSFFELIIELITVNLKVSAVSWLALIIKYTILGYSSLETLVDLGITSCLWKLHVASSNLDDDSDIAANISQSIAEVIRALCDSPSCIDALASHQTIIILKRAVLLCPKHAPTLYNVAVALYSFAERSSETRQRVAARETVDIIQLVYKNTACVDLVAASVCLFLLDSKCRGTYAIESIALTILSLIEGSPSEDTLYNVVSSIFAMSKMPSCREWLSSAPISADIHLLRLSQSDISSNKIKANIARALKNLTSEAAEALEEGAVAALIAMSLEGKTKNNKISDETLLPIITPLNIQEDSIPQCISEVVPQAATWYVQHVLTWGGAAGKGPEAPEPPAMSSDNASENEDIDASESESKTKMAFAKMQCPAELRESYLLQDKDFEQTPDTDETDIAESSSVEQDAGIEVLSQEETEGGLIIKDGVLENNSEHKGESGNVNISTWDELKGPTTDGRTEDISKLASDKKPGHETKKEAKSKGPATSKGTKAQKDSNMADKAVKLGLFT